VQLFAPVRVQYGQGSYSLEGTVKHVFERLTAAWAAKFFIGCAMVAALALAATAQNGAISPYQDEKDGVSAGGKWMAFESEDKMTAAHKVRFELLADNYVKDSDYKPRVELICTDHKLTLAEFNPGTKLAWNRPPGPWGQPQIEVRIRVNDTHKLHGWNWLPRHTLSMDKGTTREMIGAEIFKVEVNTRVDHSISEFSPAGLDLGRVKEACDLTPKKPSRD